ncbi:MAG: hypothetical protein JWO10_2019 [Microbacteriaceae bacterium]|nr:hypothetical protein [Microbacteriaceae bacterium]
MIVAILAVSILDLIVVLILASSNAKHVWPIIGVFPLLGLPIAMILILTLVILSARRRSSDAAAEAAAINAPTTKKAPRS